MNAGTSYGKALEQARANAKATNTSRYLILDQNGKNYQVTKTPPKGPMASVYTEVRPDGTCKIRQPEE
jgi:hypothetical protein